MLVLGGWLLLKPSSPPRVAATPTAQEIALPRASAPPAAHKAARSRPARSPSFAQLAGQRVIYAYSGLRPPSSLLSLIRAGEAGGVILFGPNVASRSQIRGVISRLQHLALASPFHAPILVLTDQEGGEVRRLPGAPVASEKQIGAASDAGALARAAGAGAGRNLASVGINVNLAPVLDVYRRPGNFIDEFERSYSRSPATVAALGGAFISAQQPTGVAATAKHFPGLGAATRFQNTDASPVRLPQSLGTLRSIDEAPYRAAIRAGVKLVMTSWATYPDLDPRLPAGLSPTVIGRELRGRLGFHGVTITDGLDAGAIRHFGSLGRRGVLAAAAGADLILCATTDPARNTPHQGIAVLHALTAALAEHRLGLNSAQQAMRRIMALRRGLAP
jgi:beta-N-acetylhexosaminidase